MAVRVMDFVQTHPMADSGYQSVAARLQERIKRANVLVVQQGSGIANEHAAVGNRNAIRDKVHQQLRHLVRVADLAMKDNPELARRFGMPNANAPNRAFMAAAQMMLDAATPEKALLTTLGLGDAFVDKLTKAMADFDVSTESAHAGRNDHVGAGADLEAVVNECVKLVGVLDGLTLAGFADNVEVLAAWKSASNVAGPFKLHQGGQAEVAAPAPAPAPAPAVDPGPAQPKASGE